MFFHDLKKIGKELRFNPGHFIFGKKIISGTGTAIRKIKLQLTITYNTSGLVRYIDENNCPKIIEFYGKKWEKEISTTAENARNFKVFVNNSFLRFNECLTLTSVENDSIQCKQEFLISGKNLFEGWFSLEG